MEIDGNYKTELCKNWLETAKCRYGDRCRYAHGQSELTEGAVNCYGYKYKVKNCRTFYMTKQCMYGTRCLFRHEHRAFNQLHRHYFTPQLYTLETLYQASPDKTAFIRNYKSGAPRMEAFRSIPEEADEEDQIEAVSPQRVSEGELSEGDISCILIKNDDYNSAGEKRGLSQSNSQSFLNTTQDSANEEFTQKFAASRAASPARIQMSGSEADSSAESSDEDLDIPESLICLDFI